MSYMDDAAQMNISMNRKKDKNYAAKVEGAMQADGKSKACANCTIFWSDPVPTEYHAWGSER